LIKRKKTSLQTAWIVKNQSNIGYAKVVSLFIALIHQALVIWTFGHGFVSVSSYSSNFDACFL